MMADWAEEDPRPVVPVQQVEVAVYRFPTDAPESDGTFAWDATTMIIVQARADGSEGIGYTYAGQAVATLITESLADVVCGRDALTPVASWAAMQHQVRNLGKPGIAAQAIAAVDIALWDLYATLIGQSVAVAAGAVHDAVPIYGSGGFTSYGDQQLADQLGGWVADGIPRVKIKVGTDPSRDEHRITVSRNAIGPDTELYVDANGAYQRKQALAWAERCAEYDVRWFEEPVSSDDLAGLRLLRDRGPSGMDIAAGEYGYHLPYFERMLEAGAVDCLQADATRALGVSGVLRVAALTDARSMDLSLHCAPQISAHVGAAIWHLRHLEYFHDHSRIEQLIFDGALLPQPGGVLVPDRDRPGLGITLRTKEADAYRIG